MEFEQKYRGEYIKYRLEDERVIVEHKIKNVYNKYSIKYEQIGFDEHVQAIKPHKKDAFFGLSLIINMAFLGLILTDLFGPISENVIVGYATSSLITTLLITFGLWNTTKLLYLMGEKNVFFFYERKHEKKVNTFIFFLKEKHKNYFRMKYLDPSVSLNEHEFFNVLKGMVRQGIASEDELKEATTRFLSRYSSLRDFN